MRKTFFIALLTICCTFLSYSQEITVSSQTTSVSQEVSADFILQNMAMMDMFFLQNSIGSGEHALGIDPPASETFTIVATISGISITSDIPMTLIQLCDLSGRMIHQSPKDTSTTAYTIGGPFTKGTAYVVKIYCTSSIYSRRVIIQ